VRQDDAKKGLSRMTGDQTIKCSVCKTPFLWTVAEQRAAAGQPPAAENGEPKPDRCPMCRRLAPAAGRQRGIVKWYSRTKGYGFITTVQGQDVFVHKSSLREGQVLCAGQLVEFALGDGPRGVQAESVEILPSAEAEVAGTGSAKPC
jgi:cold shock protein